MNRNYMLAFIITTALILSLMMTIPLTTTGVPGDINHVEAIPNPVNYTEITDIIALIQWDPAGIEIPDQCEFFVETIPPYPPDPADYGSGYPMSTPMWFGPANAYVSSAAFDTKDLAGPGTYTIWVHAHVNNSMDWNLSGWRGPDTISLVVNPAPPPKVVSTDPMDDEGNVPTTTTIEISFTNEMDKTTTESAFSIIPSAPGAFSWPDNHTMVLTPFVPLTEFTDYDVTINATAEDILGQTLDGNGNGTEEGSPIDNYVFNFTTGITPISIHLVEGWNLISVPYIQSQTDVDDVLSSITGDYDIVEFFDASDPFDCWKILAAKPPWFNDLSYLDETMGFYIHITKPGGTELYVNGVPPSSPTSINLNPGWNLVGYPCTVNKTRTAALNNLDIGINITSIYYYNTSQGRLVELVNPSDPIMFGYGYWMYAKHHDEWIVLPS